MNFPYIIKSALYFPTLPILYYQGKRLKADVPRLPEAKGIIGHCQVEQSQHRNLHLLTIGESTIAGVGVSSHEEGFTGSLARGLAMAFNLNIDWKVYARSGYTAKRVTYKIIPKIEEQEADLIVIGLGGNDAFALNSPKKWRKDVTELIEQLRKRFPSTLIVFCNMPPIKEFPAFTSLIKSTVGSLVEILGRELKKVVAKQDHVYYRDEVVTLQGWMKKYGLSGTSNDFFSDGIHPSKLTYQIWAKDLATGISEDQKMREHILELLNKE